MRPFFLDTGAGQCFAIHHTPGTAGAEAKALVLYLHPFAEEMNKSRRMAALQARALAQRGAHVLQIDLHGCGDSPGELQDTSWSQWLAQGAGAARWLQAQHPGVPLWLWGLRAGALLASGVARQVGQGAGLLLWQPAASGKLVLQQFLRLRLAHALDSAGGKTLMAQMKKALADGEPVDVAGYRLPAALAQGLEQAELQAPAAPAPVAWLEVSSAAEPALLPASASAGARWQAAGHPVQHRVVPGPAFWQTTEIETAPALIDATLAAICPA